MILVIDSGNSRIKLGTWAPHAMRTGELPTLTTATFDNCDTEGLQRWLASQPAPIYHAWGVNVAGAAQRTRLDEALSLHHCTIQWQTAQPYSDTLRNGYDQPTQLGADRWTAMIGVVARQATARQPFVLASFGTATTIDIVNAEPAFLGGMILPGPALMRRSLSSGTADLPLAQSATTLFARDTHASIATGVAAAQAGAFARQYMLAREQIGQTPALYAAGGGWFDVEAETRRLIDSIDSDSSAAGTRIQYLDHPVLDGLAYMARHSLTFKGPI